MYAKIKQSTTSYVAPLILQSSLSTTGAPATGITYTLVTAYYIRDGDSTPTAITPVAGTVGTYVSSGFIAVDNTYMPGVYELSLPNAVFTSGKWAVVYVTGMNVVPVYLKFELDAINYQDNASFGLSSLGTIQTTLNTVHTAISTNLDAPISSVSSGGGGGHQIAPV